MILTSEPFASYVDRFNREDDETVVQDVPNDAAWAWLEPNMPLFDCPDSTIQEVYYFRWWVYRKHLKSTPDGRIITEFHPAVPWAGKHNSINCAVGHHLAEGRWLGHRETFLPDYVRFWFRGGGSVRAYSAWFADAVVRYGDVVGDASLGVELLDDFVANYEAWERSNLHESGLFWSNDDRDAMEMSISGPGLRPTLNSYLYADARAIARIASLAGHAELEERFTHKAGTLKRLVQQRLWDPKAAFFKVIPLAGRDRGVATWDFEQIDPARNVREQIGYIPWYFGLAGVEHAEAWRQLKDDRGFSAPFGPTTAEQRHPRFNFAHDHECLWNGPSWPFATSQTLTGLANLLVGEPQDVIGRRDYLTLLRLYAACHARTRPDGSRVRWLDENLDPFSGEWLSRRILEQWGWPAHKGGRERGKDYNHSTFCDLVISGLVGVRPRGDDVLDVRPLVPPGSWDYFCLDRLAYHGRRVTVMYDASGTRYHRGQGLRLFVDGVQVAHAAELSPLQARLPR